MVNPTNQSITCNRNNLCDALVLQHHDGSIHSDVVVVRGTHSTECIYSLFELFLTRGCFWLLSCAVYTEAIPRKAVLAVEALTPLYAEVM